MKFYDINGNEHTLTIEGLNDNDYQLVDVNITTTQNDDIFTAIYACQLSVTILVSDLSAVAKGQFVGKQITLSDCYFPFTIISNIANMGASDPLESVVLEAVDPLLFLKNKQCDLVDGQHTLIDIFDNLFDFNTTSQYKWAIQAGWGFKTTAERTTFLEKIKYDCRTFDGMTKWDALTGLLKFINRIAVLEMFRMSGNRGVLLLTPNYTGRQLARRTATGISAVNMSVYETPINQQTVNSNNRTISIKDAIHSATVECRYKTYKNDDEIEEWQPEYDQQQEYDEAPDDMIGAHILRWRDFTRSNENGYSYTTSGTATTWYPHSLSFFREECDLTGNFTALTSQQIAVQYNSDQSTNFDKVRKLLYIANCKNVTHNKPLYHWDIAGAFTAPTSNFELNTNRNTFCRLRVRGKVAGQITFFPLDGAMYNNTYNLTQQAPDGTWYLPLKFTVWFTNSDGTTSQKQTATVRATTKDRAVKYGDYIDFDGVLYDFAALRRYDCKEIHIELNAYGFVTEYAYIEDIDFSLEYDTPVIGELITTDTNYEWTNDTNNEIGGEEFSAQPLFLSYDEKNYGAVNVPINIDKINLPDSYPHYQGLVRGLPDDIKGELVLSEIRLLNDHIGQYSTPTMCETVDIKINNDYTLEDLYYPNRYIDSYFNETMLPTGFKFDIVNCNCQLNLQMLK